MDYRYIVLLLAIALVVLTALEISSASNNNTDETFESTGETVPETTCTCGATEATTIPEETVEETTEATTMPVETVPETTEVTEPTVIETTEPTIPETEPVETEPPVAYYNVPLDHDLQDYIFELCDVYQVDPGIIIAMIEKESNYQADIMGDNGAAYGLLQIHPRWHQARMDNLGVTDLLDPYQNVLVGIDLFAELMVDGNDSLVWALMAYNAGPSYATDMRNAGSISYYARRVMQIADGLKFEKI